MIEKDNGATVDLYVPFVSAFLASEFVGVLAFFGNVAHLVALEAGTGIA